jgi:hypothetical protein
MARETLRLTRLSAEQRRVFDHFLVAPVAACLEAAILRSGHILALSRYSQAMLNNISGTAAARDVLPMPVDPVTGLRGRGRIGFSGRIEDPGKNLNLLLDSLVVCMRTAGHSVTALRMGGEPDYKLHRRLEQLGIAHAVELSLISGRSN